MPQKCECLISYYLINPSIVINTFFYELTTKKAISSQHRPKIRFFVLPLCLEMKQIVFGAGLYRLI